MNFSAVVEFTGGHLDGATLRVPANSHGVPVYEFTVLAPAAPAHGWTPSDGHGIEVAVARPVVYRREPVTAGGARLGWRMVAAG